MRDVVFRTHIYTYFTFMQTLNVSHKTCFCFAQKLFIDEADDNATEI